MEYNAYVMWKNKWISNFFEMNLNDLCVNNRYHVCREVVEWSKMVVTPVLRTFENVKSCVWDLKTHKEITLRTVENVNLRRSWN